MPIYEYRCRRCRTVFEKLASRSERDGSPPCPNCECARTDRVMSLFAGHRRDDSGAVGSVAGGGSCSGCHSSSCAGCRH